MTYRLQAAAALWFVCQHQKCPCVPTTQLLNAVPADGVQTCLQPGCQFQSHIPTQIHAAVSRLLVCRRVPRHGCRSGVTHDHGSARHGQVSGLAAAQLSANMCTSAARLSRQVLHPRFRMHSTAGCMSHTACKAVPLIVRYIRAAWHIAAVNECQKLAGHDRPVVISLHCLLTSICYDARVRT